MIAASERFQVLAMYQHSPAYPADWQFFGEDEVLNGSKTDAED
jgi:hypothetical protein